MIRRMAVGLALGTASAFQAAAQQIFISGSWTGAPYTDVTGRFTHCSIGAQYGDMSVLFSLSRQNDLQLSLANDNWDLSQGDQYSVAYHVDEHMSAYATAHVVARDQVTVDVPDTLEFWGALRKGYVLSVETQQQRFQFNLTGTNRAFNRMAECVVEELQKESGVSSNPFAAEAVSGESQAIDEADAVRLVANILAQADLGQFEILSKADTPASVAHYDVVWLAPGVVGAVKIFPPGIAEEAEQLVAAIVADDSSACEGSFASGVEALRYAPDADARQAFTACNGAKPFTVFYTVYPTVEGGYYSFAHMTFLARTDSGSEAGWTDEELLNAAKSVAYNADDAFARSIPIYSGDRAFPSD